MRTAEVTPTLPRQRVVVGRVEQVSRVGGALVLAGWHGEESDLATVGAAVPALRLEASCTRFPRPVPAEVVGRGGGVTGFLAVVASELPDSPVLLRLGRIWLHVQPEQLRAALVDVRVLAGQALTAPEAVPSRRRLRAALSRLVPAAGPSRRGVAQDLHAVRDLLREPLPVAPVGPGEPRGVHVDQLYALDERSFYVRGWLCDSEAEVTSLVAVAPEGAEVELAGALARYPRPDVDAVYGGPRPAEPSGFLAVFELPSPSLLPSGWRVELRDAAGAAIEASAPDVLSDPLAARTALLGDLAHDLTPDSAFLREHAHPGLTRIVGPRAGLDEVVRTHTYGRQRERVDVTVVVPLYKRLDFLEHQLAAFVHDPAMRHVDLVYVLDSPELSDEAVALAEGLSRMYDVPFRLVLLRRNLGFAGANIVGAALARGRLLLLLNSDVLPDRPGWLAGLVEAHDRLPDVGAVGAKLLYEDDSLQHAGMYFERPVGSALWTNGHYFKGLHKSFPPACTERAVPALTGACLLLATALWNDVGGLSGGFVQGDYEDSDLCLRLLQRGLRNWYVPSVELYHLEGQSYPDELRRAVGRYNTWLQTHLWDEQVALAMHEHGTAPVL